MELIANGFYRHLEGTTLMLRQMIARRKSLRRKNLSSQNLRRSFESLEARQVMAGNVTAIVDGTGQLIITGDDADNGIFLTQVGHGKFQVMGFDADGAATTVNGSSTAVTLSGVTSNISILNGNGDDIVQVDYFNHQGNLTIDALEGHDTINIGNSDRSSFLVGNLDVNYAGSYTVNLLNTHVVGSATMSFTGLIIMPAYTPPQPFIVTFEFPTNSYAITNCSFAEDLTIRTHASAIQAFLENVHLNGKITINNESFTSSYATGTTEESSFIVLNKVSTLGGLVADVFSSTSFVMNECVMGTVVPNRGEGDLVLPNVRIGLSGKNNITQISNSQLAVGLQITNIRLIGYSFPISWTDMTLNSIPNFDSIPPDGSHIQSQYDIVQLTNVNIKTPTSIRSNGTIDVEDSVFETLTLDARSRVELQDVTATKAFLKAYGETKRTSVAIDGGSFTDLNIASAVANVHSFNLKIRDTKVTGNTAIDGRATLDYLNPINPTPVFATGKAEVLIEKSELGTLYYSYRTLPLYDSTLIGEDPHDYSGLYGGEGKDNLTIRQSTINKFFAQLGAGDDSLTFEESKILTDGFADGNANTDKLTIDNASQVTKASFINFENGAGSSGGSMTVSGGGSLDIGGTIVMTGNPISIGGSTVTGGTLSGGSISYTGTTNVHTGTLTIAGSTTVIGTGTKIGNGTGVITISTTSGPTAGMSNEEAFEYLKTHNQLTVGQKVLINGQEFIVA